MKFIEATQEITFAVLESGLNSLLDMRRITAKQQVDNMNFWTADTGLTYEFFDDR